MVYIFNNLSVPDSLNEKKKYNPFRTLSSFLSIAVRSHIFYYYFELSSLVHFPEGQSPNLQGVTRSAWNWKEQHSVQTKAEIGQWQKRRMANGKWHWPPVEHGSLRKHGHATPRGSNSIHASSRCSAKTQRAEKEPFHPFVRSEKILAHCCTFEVIGGLAIGVLKLLQR